MLDLDLYKSGRYPKTRVGCSDAKSTKCWGRGRTYIRIGVKHYPRNRKSNETTVSEDE
jgi:hypothetical protein